eukprot:g19278.t1
MLINQTWEKFDAVFEAKSRAAAFLHDALEKNSNPKLKFLWLFSSTSVYGNMGQLNYSASNSWLDALARHRLALGKPCAAPQWGAWGEVGMAAQLDEAIQKRFQAGPQPPFTNAEGLWGLECGLRSLRGACAPRVPACLGCAMAWWCRSGPMPNWKGCGREQICCNEYEEICETIKVDSILPRPRQRRARAEWAMGAEEPVSAGQTFSFKADGPLPVPRLKTEEEDSSTHEPNMEDMSAPGEASPLPDAEGTIESPHRPLAFRHTLQESLPTMPSSWRPIAVPLETRGRMLEEREASMGDPDWEAQLRRWRENEEAERKQLEVERLRVRLEDESDQRQKQERWMTPAAGEEEHRRRQHEEAERKKREAEEEVRIEEEVAERVRRRVEEETQRQVLVAQRAAERRQREKEEEQRRLAALEEERQRILEEEAKRLVALEQESQQRDVEEGERQRQRLLRRLWGENAISAAATMKARSARTSSLWSSEAAGVRRNTR